MAQAIYDVQPLVRVRLMGPKRPAGDTAFGRLPAVRAEEPLIREFLVWCRAEGVYAERTLALHAGEYDALFPAADGPKIAAWLAARAEG